MTIHKTSYHSSLVQEPHEIILLNVHQAGNLGDIKLIIFHVFNLLIHLVKRTDGNIQHILIYSQHFSCNTGLLSQNQLQQLATKGPRKSCKKHTVSSILAQTKKNQDKPPSNLLLTRLPSNNTVRGETIKGQVFVMPKCMAQQQPSLG